MSMTPSRKKLITSSVLLLGVAVVVVAGITLYPSLRERYWIWKLESGTKPEWLEAVERLQEVGSGKSVPKLIDAFADALDDAGHEWTVELSTSRIAYRSRPEGDDFLSLRIGLTVFIDAIREMSERRPEVRQLLESYLSSDSELFRAVAASILFEGTSRASQYVSEQRLSGWGGIEIELYTETPTAPSPPAKFRALPSVTGLEWGRRICFRFAATSPLPGRI